MQHIYAIQCAEEEYGDVPVELFAHRHNAEAAIGDMCDRCTTCKGTGETMLYGIEKDCPEDCHSMRVVRMPVWPNFAEWWNERHMRTHSRETAEQEQKP